MLASVSRPSLIAHRGFDIVGLDGDFGGQIDGARIGKQDVVFEADAKAFVGNVDAGFDGEDPAGFERFVCDAVIMDTEAERMAKAMHEVFFAGGFGEGLLVDVDLLDQAELEQLLVHLRLGLRAANRDAACRRWRD